MAQQYDNPFVGLGLILPEAQRDFYDQYCQTQAGGRRNVDRRPFRRMVDLWFAGLSLAARKQLKPIDLAKEKTSEFITGEIFDREDSWRIQTLMLVAIAVEENLEIVQDPRHMMDIANGLAAAGVPHIVEMLHGDQHPIWNLSEALDNLLRSDVCEEEDQDQDQDRLRLADALNKGLHQ